MGAGIPYIFKYNMCPARLISLLVLPTSIYSIASLEEWEEESLCSPVELDGFLVCLLVVSLWISWVWSSKIAISDQGDHQEAERHHSEVHCTPWHCQLHAGVKVKHSP